MVTSVAGNLKLRQKGTKLPTFIRHLNGYYRTRDILQNILDMANKSKGLGILTSDFIEQKSLQEWLKPGNEYKGADRGTVDDADKKKLSIPNAMEGLLKAKQTYANEAGGLVTYKEMYNNPSVQK